MKTKLNFKDKNEFLNKYENEAKEYDNNRLTTFEDKVVLDRQIKFIDKIIRKNKPEKILEAGCGTGRILIPLTKKGYNIEGFDLSKNMLAELNKKNEKVKTKVGDIEKIPYEDNTFDMVYSITVLMHLPDAEKGISELVRVTKPGGIIVCDLPNKESIWTKLSVMLQPNMKRSRLYTRKDIKKMLKENKNHKVEGIFSYARTFYKMPVVNRIIYFLDRHVPLPISQRTVYMLVIKK